MGRYFRGDRYLIRGSVGREKINVTFGEPLFSEGPLLSEFYGIWSNTHVQLTEYALVAMNERKATDLYR